MPINYRSFIHEDGGAEAGAAQEVEECLFLEQMWAAACNESRLIPIV